MRRSMWSAAGGLAAAAYFCGERLFPPPDFFAGLLLGLGAGWLAVGLPPLSVRGEPGGREGRGAAGYGLQGRGDPHTPGGRESGRVLGT